jgi:hypothetical protein
MEILLIALLAVFLLAFYFLPTIVASKRNHPNILSIFVINLFLGCTLLGWVVALTWACARMNDVEIAKLNDELKKQQEQIEKLQATHTSKSQN